MVEAHGPEARDLGFGVGVQFRDRLDAVGGHARHLGGFFDRVVRDEFCVFLERDIGGIVGLGAAGRLLLQRMLGAQAVTDVGLPALEQRVLVDEIPVDASGLDDVIGDGVKQVQIGMRLENRADVGEVERAVLECREHRNPHMRRAEAAVGNPGPQDRVHLRHVGAPQHVASAASMSS
jgi:hypothetical protein